MYKTLDIFKLSHAMASHANARQRVVAENVANADTSGYRAKDISSFTDHVASMRDSGAIKTRSKHFGGFDTQMTSFKYIQTSDEPSPNGNSVSLETEMMKAGEARHQQDTALAVYRSAMNIMRSSIGKG